MKTVLEALTSISKNFTDNKIENGRRQAEDLLCDVLGCDRMKLYLNFEQPLTEHEWSICSERLFKRLQGQPMSYIHGSVDFYHCKIQVTPDVLIPRQETEILVDKIVQTLSKEDCKGKVLLDLCCGSGCIGLALKKRFPELTVFLSDYSAAALKVARKNAEHNHLQVTFLEGDLLQPFINNKANYVVCNPPYISEEEFASLDREVRDFEPRQALVSGVTGLEFYQRLAQELPNHLYPHAKVWFEIGYNQGESLRKIFSDSLWLNPTVENDYARQNRFFHVQT
jgi:release factor glutamine methyltransferase